MMTSCKTYNQKIKFFNKIKKNTQIIIRMDMQKISKYKIKFLIKMIKFFKKIIYLQDLLRMNDIYYNKKYDNSNIFYNKDE